MKISETPNEEIKKLITLIISVRPDIKDRVAGSGSYLATGLRSQYPDLDFTELRKYIEATLLHWAGDINLGTVFTWVRKFSEKPPIWDQEAINRRNKFYE